MSLKPLYVLAPYAAATAVLACAPASAQQMVSYTEDKLPYTVSLPASWYGIQIEGPAGVNLSPVQKPPFQPLIRLTYIPKVEAINTASKATAAFEQEMSAGGAVKVRQLGSKAATYGNVPGLETEYALSAADPKKGSGEMRVRLWMGIGAKNVYAFQLLDKPATYAANRDKVFTPILKSVKFK